MNADGAELMKNGRRMAKGEASKGSLRNLGKLLCGSRGVECIFFPRLQEGLARKVGEREGRQTVLGWY
jgi:hypothetical protein